MSTHRHRTKTKAEKLSQKEEVVDGSRHIRVASNSKTTIDIMEFIREIKMQVPSEILSVLKIYR